VITSNAGGKNRRSNRVEWDQSELESRLTPFAISPFAVLACDYQDPTLSRPERRGQCSTLCNRLKDSKPPFRSPRLVHVKADNDPI
jgi:hypothetical protein